MPEFHLTSDAERREERLAPRLRVWLTAGRVWALPASIMSVAFGTVLAITVGGAAFDFALFLLSLVGMALLQVGANMLNDVYDYRNGIDTQVNPASGAVVRGWITPRQALGAAVTCLLLGSALGFYIVIRIGIPILCLGAIGVCGAILYTWGPWPLKYHAFGDLAVFLNFGVLGALGAWTVQTGHLSWVPAVWAVPMSLLVIAILHSNNWRDIGSDTDGKIRTVASCLGDAGSQTYQRALLFGPFLIIALLVLLTHVTALSPRMPVTFLLTLLAMPLGYPAGQNGRRAARPAKKPGLCGIGRSHGPTEPPVRTAVPRRPGPARPDSMTIRGLCSVKSDTRRPAARTGSVHSSVPHGRRRPLGLLVVDDRQLGRPPGVVQWVDASWRGELIGRLERPACSQGPVGFPVGGRSLPGLLARRQSHPLPAGRCGPRHFRSLCLQGAGRQPCGSPC